MMKKPDFATSVLRNDNVIRGQHGLFGRPQKERILEKIELKENRTEIEDFAHGVKKL